MKPGAPDTVLGPSPGSGQRGSRRPGRLGLGRRQQYRWTFSGADRPVPVTPCSIPPSPSSLLGLSFHTYNMVIIWSSPESEEELRTEPRTGK